MDITEKKVSTNYGILNQTRIEQVKRRINFGSDENEKAANEEVKTRKRKRNPEKWQRIVNKKLRESGEKYQNAKGQPRPARHVKQPCENTCVRKCSDKILEAARLNIRNEFYKLSDAKKAHFYNKYTKKVTVGRKRVAGESKKKYSYKYFFEQNGSTVQVCRTFFCNTLNISRERIYYFHKNMLENNAMNNISVPRTPLRGKHVKKVTSEDQVSKVKEHIESFPLVESHYCRANSTRKYLSSGLSITKMYSMYKEKYPDAVKEPVYRKIFNENYNIFFFKPKKDVCDQCSEFKMKKNPTEAENKKQEEHLKRKQEGNEEREKDRKRSKDEIAVLVCDLQNVFALPKANVSCFFYKSKLNVYNLSGHCNVNKKIYNCLWNEFLSGRNGNDLASAYIFLLKRVIEDLPQNMSEIIIWSDSCVPQNRNSHLSTALVEFLESEHCGNIKKISQKYSEPGHGNLQEIDAAHSVIERHIRHLEIYSPLSLIRALLKLKSEKNTYEILQMKADDFKQYSNRSKTLAFSRIPFTKIKMITYSKESPLFIKYKISFEGEVFVVDVAPKAGIKIINQVVVQPAPEKIPKNKIEDIVSMYKYMTDEDVKYYKALLKKFENSLESMPTVPKKKVVEDKIGQGSTFLSNKQKEATSKKVTKLNKATKLTNVRSKKYGFPPKKNASASANNMRSSSSTLTEIDSMPSTSGNQYSTIKATEKWVRESTKIRIDNARLPEASISTRIVLKAHQPAMSRAGRIRAAALKK